MEARAAFRNSPAWADVVAFRNQSAGEPAPPNGHLRGMRPPASGPQAPVFTSMIETGAENLYEDDRFVLFINHTSPYPDAYPDKPERAGMAFGHMLACPKARIYNAISLEKEDAELIEYMVDKVRTLMDSFDFRRKVAEAVEKRTGEDSRFASDAAKFLFETSGRDLEFYCHVHPLHSVGHLHIHCLQANLRTSTKHDAKNTPIKTILEWITEKNVRPE